MVNMLEYSAFVVYILVCIQCVKCSDKNESRDDITEQIVEEFKGVCPYTNLCFSTARKNVTRLADEARPCCNPCDCDDSCGTACCPDKPERFLNESEVLKFKTIPEQCVYAQIRSFNLDKLNGKPYNMIGNCPVDYSVEVIKVKCSREYRDFDFEKEDIKTLMPVSFQEINVTFKNYFCAICHNAVNTNLQFWDTKVVCTNKKKLPSNISEISLKLPEESQCQVMFEPSFPTPRYDVKPCDGIIDRCNVTGTWIQYDRVLETACLSYTSEYRGFKNIHCFHCNGHTLTDEDAVCQSARTAESDNNPFMAILDFSDFDDSPSQNKGTKCSKESEYDTLKNVCRPLLCAAGMMLSKTKCKTLFPEMVFRDSSVVFDLRFRLVPTHIATRGESELLMSLVHSVFNQFIPKVDMIHTANGAAICAINAYLKLDRSLENTVKIMNRDNLTDFTQFVSHLSIAANFRVNGMKNISAVIEEMAMIYASNDYYAQYIVQYPSDDAKIPVVVRYNKSEEYINNLNQLDVGPSEHLMFLGGQNDLDDGLGILWFVDDNLLPMPRCESVLSIQPNPFCPRIELNRKEFNIDIINRKVTHFEIQGVSNLLSPALSFSKMLITKNAESVLVCADEYFAQLPTRDNSTFNGELAVLTIICLVCSIISLFLTFVIYCILPKLRTLPGLNNMALVFHLFLLHALLLIIDVTKTKLPQLCLAIGIGLHYTLLSSFFWMFICTFHMMTVFVNIKKRRSTVHTISKFVHYLVFAELISVILVISNIVVSVVLTDEAVGLDFGGSSCFIQDSIMLFYFVAIPLMLVLGANLAMFSYVIWSVSCMPDMAKHSNHERHNIIIFAKLSTLTGITWIFGFVYQFTNTLLFAYAYIIFNAGQGVFIMFSFVINKRVFAMLHSQRRKKADDSTEGTSNAVHISAINGTVRVTNIMSDATDTTDTKF